ncbi:MAG TPA: hypothetical protein VHI11_08215 [Jiangellaceae bacterium]|jgi:hypothetical protein|nr:hypothetical protein [Jiangellaceae bacterium]
MPNERLLDDASVEAVLDGRSVPSDLDALANAVGVLRETARRPIRPSHELAQFMSTGGLHRRHRFASWRSVSSTLAGTSVRLKLVAGLAAGLTGVTGAAAAAGELPDVVQASVDTGVSLITPIDLIDKLPQTVQAGVQTAVEFVTPIDVIGEPETAKGTADQVEFVAGLAFDAPAIPSTIAMDAVDPEPTASPTPTRAPAVPLVPLPSPSPIETLSPTPSPSPTASPTPEPEPTPSETPAPTPTPDPPTESPTPPAVPPGDAQPAAAADPQPAGTGDHGVPEATGAEVASPSAD